MCEELEYSDLLDRAASSKDQLERMMLVTAFAVSSYASAANASRAAHKPFNPLLGKHLLFYCYILQYHNYVIINI